MQICQNIKQKLNPRWRRPPSWIFAQTAISRPPIDTDNEILLYCRRLLPEVDCVTKIDKNNRVKMATAAILNSVYRS